MRIALFAAVLAVAGCVDASTGTGVDTSGATGVSSTDPTGNWNATQFTLTSKANSANSVDYVAQGWQVSFAIVSGGKVTLTVTRPPGTAGSPGILGGSGTLSVLGDSVTWKQSDSTLFAAGTFSRNNNHMTLDLSGPRIQYDFNGDGIMDLALLHTALISSAH